MTGAHQPSPLAATALALVRDGVGPVELSARVAAAGATLDPDRSAELLDELASLGLARVEGVSDAPTYRLTPLGERLLDGSFRGRPEHTALLVELEAMRTDLLSTIAHELRTPLTAVRTSVGLLLDPGVDPSAAERQTLLESIDRNATRMQRVVGDILDLARFRAGSVALQLRRFDAGEVARSAIASIEPLLGVRGEHVRLVLPARPAFVFADYRRIEQALVNLLSNAVKVSTPGAPIVVEVAAGADEVSWAVIDVGPGIDPDDRTRLFERFFVARADRSGARPGVGLGLPITQAIAQAHDGRIDVESRLGAGSRFTIVVPAAGPAGGHEP